MKETGSTKRAYEREVGEETSSLSERAPSTADESLDVSTEWSVFGFLGRGVVSFGVVSFGVVSFGVVSF